MIFLMAPIKCNGNHSIEEVLSLIREGNNENVKLHLENYDLFQSVDASAATLLHYSVKYGNKKMVQYLLNRGYHVDAQDSTGYTPMMIAVKRKHGPIIQTLLAAGADIMLLNYESKSVLHLACEEHDLTSDIRTLIFRELSKKISDSKEIAQKLIDAGCHLYQAAYSNNAKVLEYMLEQGFPVDSMHPTGKQTALHIAVLFHSITSVKVLLKYGANVNAMDYKGATPLFYLYEYNPKCAFRLKILLLQILLNLKATLTSCTSRGHLQIGPILINGNYKAIRILLQANIDYTAKDEISKRNVLHHLACNRNPGVVEELKLHINKFDINAVDESGLNALCVAVKRNNVEMVQLLLSQGANPNCAHNFYGYRPLYYAYSRFKPGSNEQTEQCVELLLQHNADPQFIVTKKTGQQVTVFDAATKTNTHQILKPVIAHLVVLDRLGVSITEVNSNKINSCQPLKEYFNSCQKLLGRKVSGSVTLFKLLTSDEKQLARYVGNRKLILKLTRLSYKQDLKFFHSYYHNTLKKRLSKAIEYKRFLAEVTGVICKIFKERFDKTNLIADKIIDRLDSESLKQLHLLSKMTR